MERSKTLFSRACVIAICIASVTSVASAQEHLMQAPIDNSAADVVMVQAGGPIWGLDFSTECMGFFAENPDILVNTEAGQSLSIFAVSDQDTTLAVQTPSGRFVCNDDAFGSSNPALTINAIESGLYSVWAGAFDPEITSIAMVGVGQQFPTAEDLEASDNSYSRLFIENFDAPISTNTPQENQEPVDNDIVLGAPEASPRNVLTMETPSAMVDVKSAAVEPLSNFDEACVGTSDPYNAAQITADFAADTELVFFANGGDDLTLLVIAPDGNAACSDDFAGSRNPLVSFNDIQPGAYEIYLGTYGGGEVQGTVYAGPAPAEWSGETPASLRSAFTNSFGSDVPLTAGFGQLLQPLPTIQPLSILRAEAGTYGLDTGSFPLDLTIDAGGAAELAAFDDACSGFAGQAATLAIEVEPALWGEELVIEAISDVDGVMALLSPDGNLYCNDDGPNGLNPQIIIQTSSPGPHKIWIGSLTAGEVFVADVSIDTNIMRHTGTVDQQAAPAFGQQIIQAGEATTIRFASQASTETALIETAVLGCEGVVTTAPALDLILEPGFTNGITLRTDGAVLMRGPDDLWICQADGNLAFDTVIPGTYRTWVGPQATLLSILPQK